jgi:hypothetical protein
MCLSASQAASTLKNSAGVVSLSALNVSCQTRSGESEASSPDALISFIKQSVSGAILKLSE